MTENNEMRVGIIGAGTIAGKIASTLKDLDGVVNFAVASRSLEKAQAFAREWGFERAYGSYAELLDDGDVDLVYIATPHSHHYDVTREAILKDKPCLVEKAFMANYRESKEIVDLARERKVFVAGNHLDSLSACRSDDSQVDSRRPHRNSPVDICYHRLSDAS